MSDDRQLLEEAAMAAGIAVEFSIFSDGSYFCFKAGGDCFNDDWDPLTDDGDALRLAVKLRLAVNHYGEGTAVLLPHHSPEGFSTSPAVVEDNSGDPYAATRRAIVRAAAAIGRQMRESE